MSPARDPCLDLVRENPLALLRSDLLSERSISRLRVELSAGDLCVVRNAFLEPFADAVFGCLDRVPGWQRIERRVQPFSGYRSLALPDRGSIGGEASAARDWFADPRVRNFMTDLSGADCEGDPIFNMTHYGPGDYTLPHNDVGGSNSVSFVWSLSRDWLPKWGGHFFWCAPPASISPTFNTLILYRVALGTYHFVSPVSSEAQGKRLTISGWWTAKEPLPENPLPRAPWYKGPLEDLGDGTFVLRVDPSTQSA